MDGALKVIEQAFKYIDAKESDAMNKIVNALIDMETNKMIPEVNLHENKYAKFIIQDIKNACKQFTGKKIK